ncbi:MAG: phage/plasmid primase, P4 family [Bacteroidota bacterium]
MNIYPLHSPSQRDFAIHDVANANRFAEMHHNKVLFDHTYREWYVWDEQHWAKDHRNSIMDLAKETAYRIHADAPRDNRDWQRQAVAIFSRNGLRNMLECAKSLPELSTTAEDWDRDPYLFNVHNGTIDLRTSTLREHRPEDRITMLAGCAFDPQAEAPHFISCLEQYWPDMLGEDLGIAEFLITCMGYCLSGLNNEKLLILLHGAGDTGKTTIMRALQATWGEYFKTADWSTFAHQRNGDTGKHRTDLVRLKGARIVSASEGDDGCRMSEGIIKRVTGRTPLVVRDLMSKPISFLPEFKLWFDTNGFPSFPGQDRAMWNRVRGIFFKRVISFEDQQRFREEHGDLDQLLAAEASGILNLAMQGWQEYQRHQGIPIPEAIGAATTSFHMAADSLGQFLDDRCMVEHDSRITKTDFYTHYIQWSRQQGENPPSSKQITRWMVERGFTEVKSHGIRYWMGIRTTEPHQ